MRNTLSYVCAFVLVFAAATIEFLFTLTQTTVWYESLVKPVLTPPDWLFAPLWIILYALSALALARLWNAKDSYDRKRCIFVFTVQLSLTVLWSLLFFSFHDLTMALVDAVVLWFAVLVLTLASYDVDRTSFWLLIPYFAWITFAMILTVAIWWVN